MALTGKALSLQRDKERRAKSQQPNLDKPLPYPTVAGASTTGLNAAQLGGASGRGFEDLDDQAAISEYDKNLTESGFSLSERGDKKKVNEKGVGIKKFDEKRAKYALRGAGVSDRIKEKSLVGDSTGEARRKIEAEKTKKKAEQAAQQTATTSAVFNPEITKRTQRAIDKLGFALNDITNSPFEGKTTKLNKTGALIESTSKQLAQLFKTPEEFQQAYNADTAFKGAIDNLQKLGGKPDSITSAITAPTMPLEGTQTTSDYLANISNPQANQEAEKKAMAELIPERDVDQAEIMRLAGIPADLKKIYWGDEETTGLLAQQKLEAEEEIRIEEQEEKNQQNSLRAKAKSAINRNRAELKLADAKVEESRLAAKNYMTGYLAKLGALNTTGAAGVAIQTLETTYDMKRQELATTVKYANQELELNLTTDLNNTETQTDRDILKIQQDLTKTTEEVFKEVAKAQQQSDKEIYTITAGYTKTLRERTKKYEEDAKKEAEAYAKEYAKIAARGLSLSKLSQTVSGNGSGYLEGRYVPKRGVLLPNGTYAKIHLTPTQQQDVEAAGISGLSTIRFFNNLSPAVREQIVRDHVANRTNYDVAKMQEMQRAYDASNKSKASGGDNWST